MHARLGVRGEDGQRREHDPGRAEYDRDGPGPVDADAERSRRLVAGTRGSGHVGRLEHRRQPLGANLERGQHLVAPTPLRDVEEQRPGRVGDVDRALAQQPQAHVVLR